MDNEKLQKAIRKLNWEAKHWNRTNGKGTDNAFLAEIDHVDADFAQALRDRGIDYGKLLDIGTGSGRQAIAFAGIGFEVTATDISSIGIADAVGNAAAEGVDVTFLEDDITHTVLTDTFDVIADRGCFTLLPKDTLAKYATCVASLLRPGGILLLKVDRKKADRIDCLLDRFTVVETCESSYPLEYKLVKATFFVLRPN